MHLESITEPDFDISASLY